MSSYRRSNIMQLQEQAKKILEECEIPYKDVPIRTNNRLKRSIGRYVQYTQYGVVKGKIEMSKAIMDSRISDENVLSTLLHEYIHSCQGCQNHGSKFTSYCAKINAKYPQYELGRYVSESKVEELKKVGYLQANSKYTVYCPKCGNEWHRASMSNLVKHPEFYRCRCGETLKRRV